MAPSENGEKQQKAESDNAEAQLKSTLRLALDETAYERIVNISVANKQFFASVARYALAYFRRSQRRLTDAELLAIINEIKRQNERPTSITFHKK
ncbi:MAG: DNA-binding protein [Candidatus Bilamarchaeum sp.]